MIFATKNRTKIRGHGTAEVYSNILKTVEI